MPQEPLLPQARRASRLLVGLALATGLAPTAGRPRLAQGVVLGALVLGMPHGAADTELLRAAAAGSRSRHVGLLAGYALLATGATAVVRRGGPWVERAVLLLSAAHFAEGELACWRAGPGRTDLLRAVAAATTTVLLPAAVGAANRRPGSAPAPGNGPAAAAVASPVAPVLALADRDASRAVITSPARAAGAERGAAVLRRSVPVAGLAAFAAAGSAALAVRGDHAADTALLLGLDLAAPPAVAFAGYFGGWHALRHTARVVDALVAAGQLPRPASLPGAVAVLGRRSAWAAVVGGLGAAALITRDPERASDAAFSAVLGLTVPHMTTVALTLRSPDPVS